MHALTVVLGPHRYALRTGISARRLENRIVTAMRRGAGIVRLPLASGDDVDAVVTPAVPVLVERTHPVVSAVPVTAPEPPVDWPEFS